MMLLRTLPLGLLLLMLLLSAAGRLDVPAFWVYSLGIWLFVGASYARLLRHSPALVSERIKPPNDRDSKTQRIMLPLMATHLVLAGLDVRFGWTTLSAELHVVGFGLVFVGLGFAAWTLFENPFASSAVRIQAERSQRVISTGPYALVRHPMYFGTFIFTLGSGMALGSLAAGLVLVPTIAIFIRRTLIEDHMLQEELDGYRQYAARVRWRMVPGLF